ncbi:hypothetical protein [Actinoplanes couchii]|uniref:hypothetical protein n=1 Tax=Actinoplanes couchii TaxID=403638 RepID=UPI00286337A5|nr:hypothetical protein [Actinoplanes couchii]MDR6323240.1 hypothetical protein [Actinoplanes couchii]
MSAVAAGAVVVVGDPPWLAAVRLVVGLTDEVPEEADDDVLDGLGAESTDGMAMGFADGVVVGFADGVVVGAGCCTGFGIAVGSVDLTVGKPVDGAVDKVASAMVPGF